MVYNPPGYDPRAENQKDPSSICCTVATSERLDSRGPRLRDIRANVIGQSEAQGKASPMIIVLPAGYGGARGSCAKTGVFRDRCSQDRNFDQFREALLTEGSRASIAKFV